MNANELEYDAEHKAMDQEIKRLEAELLKTDERIAKLIAELRRGFMERDQKISTLEAEAWSCDEPHSGDAAMQKLIAAESQSDVP